MIAVAAAAAVAWGTGAASPSAAAAAAPAPVTVDYVALGDSYAAGLGAGTSTGACRVTDGAYPRLWSDTAPDAVSLTLAACSGARATEVTAGQLGSLDAGTDLVTVTAGANDLDVFARLRLCMDSTRTAECAALRPVIAQELATTVPAAVTTLLAQVRTAAPHAKLVLTGYPLPFADVTQCPSFPVSIAVRQLANEVIGGLNAVLATTAATAGATFVDAAGAFAGHEVCTAEPWIVGLNGLSAGTVLHPNRLGQTEGYLAAMLAAVGPVEQLQEWIAQRDAVPSPGVDPSPTDRDPSSPDGVDPSPTDGESAPPVAGGGGGGGELPVTGVDATTLLIVGVVLAGAGAGMVWSARRRRIRVVAG